MQYPYDKCCTIHNFEENLLKRFHLSQIILQVNKG